MIHLTRYDIPAVGHLTDAEIERLLAAGAKRVVVEELEHGTISAIGCFMKRSGRIGFRLASGKLASLSTEARSGLLDHIEKRLRAYAETLPPTDEEYEAMDRSQSR